MNLNKYPERESNLFYILRVGLPTLCNTESEYQDLTFEKLFVYYASKGITLNKRTFKKNMGLLTEAGKYNLLAQLLSDNSYIPIRFAIFNGIDKAFAIQAGREIRVMVKPDEVNDDGMKVIAREMAAKIQAEVKYPGQIKINLIRESRAVDYAK